VCVPAPPGVFLPVTVRLYKSRGRVEISNRMRERWYRYQLSRYPCTMNMNNLGPVAVWSLVFLIVVCTIRAEARVL